MIVTVQIVVCLLKEAFQSLLFRYREGHSVDLEELTKTKGEQLEVIYYIDPSVLLKNTPLAKFIRTTSETRVAYFPYPH